MARSGIVRKSSDDYTQLCGYIPKDIAKRFKLLCMSRDINQSEGVEQAVLYWMSGKADSELPQTIAELVEENRNVLKAYEIKNLDALANGAIPSPADVLLIAAALQIDSIALHQIYLKSFPEHNNNNGTLTSHQ